jgi:hypothetical protein
VKSLPMWRSHGGGQTCVVNSHAVGATAPKTGSE